MPDEIPIHRFRLRDQHVPDSRATEMALDKSVRLDDGTARAKVAREVRFDIEPQATPQRYAAEQDGNRQDRLWFVRGPVRDPLQARVEPTLAPGAVWVHIESAGEGQAG